MFAIGLIASPMTIGHERVNREHQTVCNKAAANPERTSVANLLLAGVQNLVVLKSLPAENRPADDPDPAK
jgi:hypothetical protein